MTDSFKILASNFPPVGTANSTYASVFEQLLRDSASVAIACGYVSTEAVVDLTRVITENGGPYLDLCVGMATFEGLTRTQLEALKQLDAELIKHELGSVSLVTAFPYHGKTASFQSHDGTLTGLVGSSNLSNIISRNSRLYEVDCAVTGPAAQQIDELISHLVSDASQPLGQLSPKIVEPSNLLLTDHLGVEKVRAEDLATLKARPVELNFAIPLKGDKSQSSGLNASFGKGRENRNGFVLPRSWYEVELIVSNTITTSPGYPQAERGGSGGAFAVVTDDGWSFMCKVSGDYSKNLRSAGDLRTLGKWMKGRLENAGVLTAGQRVTDKALNDYGRNTLTLRKHVGDNRWVLDFSV